MIAKKVLSNKVAIILILTVIILSISLVGAIINYTSIINSKDIAIQSKDSQIQILTNQRNQIQTWLDENKTLLRLTQTWLEGNISYFNSQIEGLDSQILLLTNQRDQLYVQITNLQDQISSLNTQIQTLNLQILDLQSQIHTLIDILLSKGVFYDDFVGSSLSSGWIIENLEGNYSLNNGILTLFSDAGSQNGLAIYREYEPQTDNFIVSARVRSSRLDFVALRIQFQSLPICLSATAVTLQMRQDRFLAVYAYDVYSIKEPTGTGIWYVLEMKVQKTPFTIVFNVYTNDGTLYGTMTLTDFDFTYDDIRFLCLQLWNTGLNPIYDIDWFKIEEL